MRYGVVSRLPWVWTVLVALLSTVPLFLGGYVGEGLLGVAGSLAWLLLPLLFTVQGTLIMRRSPGNTIAWLLMIVGFGALATGIADAVVANQEGTPTVWENLAMTAQNGWLAIMFPVLLLLFLFPTGRFSRLAGGGQDGWRGSWSACSSSTASLPRSGAALRRGRS